MPPADLSCTPSADGVNRLKWRANGNTRDVQYVIEAKVGASGGWADADVTTKTTCDHTGRAPGERVTYRVKARRSGRESAYSNEAVAYG